MSKTVIRELEIGDLLKIVYEKRRQLLWLTVATCLIAIVYSLLAPKIYRARASFFVPPNKN